MLQKKELYKKRNFLYGNLHILLKKRSRPEKVLITIAVLFDTKTSQSFQITVKLNNQYIKLKIN